MRNERSNKTIARVLESIEMSLTKAIDAEAAPGTSALKIKVEDWVCRWVQQNFGVEDPTKHLQQMVIDHIEKCYYQKMYDNPDELSIDERISLIKAAKAALRDARTPCIVFSWHGKQFHYGPMDWGGRWLSSRHLLHFERPRELETWRLDTRHRAPVPSLKE